ncbi:S1 RNA-binding domain-containing protein, partial [Campylobacter jejuni]
ELGQEFQGIVKKIAPFGAFVELKNGVDGLLHSSKSKHLNLSENQSLKVKISEIKNGKISVDLCE